MENIPPVIGVLLGALTELRGPASRFAGGGGQAGTQTLYMTRAVRY